ncbi:hypothetical protein LZP69_14695 [Shewanella sp. AS1]|uniref:hypothetical protein n=1 Tax=Shewanella sp. AS1 TaxID=2907626 RepID=UPI001F46096E|nr:hypothetical protein [Shewanella sp. AS1]MCE9680404.1 hypothetical protein [Shewanella sp. AS1]
MKKWLIILCCCVFLIASMLTSGIARSLVDLCAFIAMLVLVFALSNAAKSNAAKSAKVQDKE